NSFPIESGGLSITQYAFGPTGERIFYQPTVLELGSIHVTNVGIGLRFASTRWAELMPNSYAFVEGSRLKRTDPTLEQWRIFAGALFQEWGSSVAGEPGPRAKNYRKKFFFLNGGDPGGGSLRYFLVASFFPTPATVHRTRRPERLQHPPPSMFGGR